MGANLSLADVVVYERLLNVYAWELLEMVKDAALVTVRMREDRQRNDARIATETNTTTRTGLNSACCWTRADL